MTYLRCCCSALSIKFMLQTNRSIGTVVANHPSPAKTHPPLPPDVRSGFGDGVVDFRIGDAALFRKNEAE